MRKIRSRAYGSLMEELKKDDREAFDVVSAYVRELQSEQWKLRQRVRDAEGTIAVIARTTRGRAIILDAVVKLPAHTPSERT